MGWTKTGSILGPEGNQGAVGLTGATGQTGQQGIQGVKGDTGAQGIQGVKGDTGLTGATPVITTTSSTLLQIEAATKTFAISTPTNLVVGQTIKASSIANAANYMAGAITAISGTSLSVLVTDIGGSGTFSDWRISLSGVAGVKGATGDVGPTGNTGSVGQTGQTGPSPIIASTSTSSHTIGTGSKVFVTAVAMNLSVGQLVRIWNTPTPANYMLGSVSAISGTALTVNVTETGGSGTLAAWSISLSGITGAQGQIGPAGNVGAQGPVGPTPVINTTSSTSMNVAVGSKVFTTAAATNLVAGQTVKIWSTTSPANYMVGEIASVSGTSMTVSVSDVSGSGTFTSWSIGLSGVTGPVGATGLQGATGSQGPAGTTPVITATSSTSQAISISSKTFTTSVALSYTIGQTVKIWNTANVNNYMIGNVTAISGNSLTVNVTEIAGTGTFTAWTISLSGVTGANARATFRGAGTSFPAGSLLGDIYYHTGLVCMMQCTNEASQLWTQISHPNLADANALTAISTNYASVLHDNFMAFQVDLKQYYYWNSTAAVWRRVSNWVTTTQTSYNNLTTKDPNILYLVVG